jgi:NifU-like protein involved in Fe-S cluster formation
MSDQIYQTDLLRLAGAAHGHGRLPAPQASATLDNPMCGDRVTFDITLDGQGKVVEIAQTTRACVLCQASASIIAAHAPGHGAEEIAATERAVFDMLKTGGDAPAGEWADLAVFAPVRETRSRHVCVLLPFETVAAAIAEAKASA